VRINPNEVHIDHPDFYPEIYHAMALRTDRDARYFGNLTDKAVAMTIDHDLHTIRRGAIAAYFSNRSIHSFEKRIAGVMATMERFFHESPSVETVVNISHLSAAVSLDVASEYFPGQEKSTGELAKVEPGKQFTELLKKTFPMNNFGRHFPCLWLL
jgi:cytochrome P450